MSDSDPKLGEVVRYAYLWRSEARRGQEEGVKDRPCVVTYCKSGERGEKTVAVLPITHTPQKDDKGALRIPIATARRLGLDDRPSWIVTDEANRFTWPGPDLRPADPKNPRKGVVLGVMPEKLVLAARDRAIDHQKARQFEQVGRDPKDHERRAALVERAKAVRARQDRAQSRKSKEHSYE
ncbi:MAG: type II toxin-antitoxin system PemK/MazF family toxin [Pseudomonadota bacterium]